MNLSVIEKSGQRVLTTTQLAESFETDSKTINRNFQRNSERFVEGKHFYSLSGEELKKFKNKYNLPEYKFSSILYLWTFIGCVLQANSSRSVSVKKIYEIADCLGIDTTTLFIAGECSKEYEFGQLLDSIIPSGLRIEKQFVIGNYRLDFYLPSLGLIIEFDECAHSFKKLNDKKRENEIKDLLPGVQFIRISESEVYSGVKVISEFLYNENGGYKNVDTNY